MSLEDIVPLEALLHLPFCREPLEQWEAGLDFPDRPYSLVELICDLPPHNWLPSGVESSFEGRQSLNSTTDVLAFLYDLFGKLDESYRSYGLVIYSTGVTRFRQWAQQFQTLAGASAPGFIGDSDFGRAAKYSIAWQGVVSAVLSESAFFSLAHYRESTEDLNCSVLLAASLYYKQALQVLRNYLESMVLQMHFCLDPAAFKAWREGDYRVPFFQGKNGLLRRLADCNLLSEELAHEAASLYSLLNLFSTPQWVVWLDPPLYDILCRTSERRTNQVYI